MTRIRGLGYLRVQTRDIDHWRELTVDALGSAEGSGPDPDGLYLRTDERRARLVATVSAGRARDLPHPPAVIDAAAQGLGADDMDAAVLYDPFIPLVLPQLEELGFCEPGEATDFAADGHLEVGGRLPLNTHGGQLGEAYLHGMDGIAEGVRLIRGTSVNQPDDIGHVRVTAGTGVPTGGLILGADR